jgi:ferredoxin
MAELYVQVTSKCCGYTICAEICPEVFSLDDSGFAVAIEGPIAPELEANAREATSSCPESAIELGDRPFSSG